MNAYNYDEPGQDSAKRLFGRPESEWLGRGRGRKPSGSVGAGRSRGGLAAEAHPRRAAGERLSSRCCGRRSGRHWCSPESASRASPAVASRQRQTPPRARSGWPAERHRSRALRRPRLGDPAHVQREPVAMSLTRFALLVALLTLLFSPVLFAPFP